MTLRPEVLHPLRKIKERDSMPVRRLVGVVGDWRILLSLIEIGAIRFEMIRHRCERSTRVHVTPRGNELLAKAGRSIRHADWMFDHCLLGRIGPNHWLRGWPPHLGQSPCRPGIPRPTRNSPPSELG